MSVFFFFALATVVGALSTLFWIPEDDLGRGYFQMNALILLGLLALVWAVVVLPPLQPFGAATGTGAGRLLLAVGSVGACLYYGAIWRERWRASRWAAALALAGCGGALVVATGHLISTATPLPFREPLAIAGLLTSALLLGWSLIAMLLGHWYLVAPRLTFRHLVVFCWVLLGTVVLRFAALAGTLVAAASVDELVEPNPWRVLTSVEGQGMFFWFRLTWGLLIPLALALMSLHCARQRSNQSATGILYVLVVGTFIGEITAYYLAVTTGIPA
jgi:hypothetical protein